MSRYFRAVFAAILACLAAPAAWAENAPGVTATEIKIGQTQPYSGPAEIFGAVGKAEQAYFRMIDAQGGVNAHKIVLVSRDDGYDPAKTMDLTKQLIETDKVAAIFSIQGARQNLAIRDYLNQRGIPQLFTVTGADIAGDFRHFPWTIGGTPLYRIEAQIYGRRILIDQPNAKVAVLYQNDDFGKSYIIGLQQVFHESFDKRVVKIASYEPGAASIATQLKTLHDSGADVLITAATAKHATQAIAGVYDLGWHPTHYITFTAQSVSVLAPAGLDKAKGLISATSYMDPGDPRWTDDGSLKPYNDFVAKYLPGDNPANAYFLTGYILAQAMVQVLKQCGDDLSRVNIMRQAANLKSFHPVGLLPGVSFFTSRTQYHPIVEAALERFNGQRWELFGDVMAGQ
ncbi:MAG TPA: ABC transporter substrate-binding protein [Stellaceae bacterium]|jgi:branched-chain amino acid transport system substrate-binding protein|nr:ABC transporter substrate-binding protein [Stellaceae bacterium]